MTTMEKCCPNGECAQFCKIGSEGTECEGQVQFCHSCEFVAGTCAVMQRHRDYADGGSNSCSGGCPGECNNTPKLCYTDYKCTDIVQDYTVCRDGGCEINPLCKCYWCATDDEDEETPHYVDYWSCSGN